jgi:uncharacterized protein involved in exopolysaccharide biosynthesis
VIESQSDHWAATPAEHYLRALWHGKWVVVTSVVICIAAAAILNAVLPKEYASQARLSVKDPVRFESSGMLYGQVMAPSTPPSADRVRFIPLQFTKRVLGIHAATLAARDAGIIGPDQRLDDRDINRLITVDDEKDTDLLTIEVRQPSAELAQRFAERLLFRTIEGTREETKNAVAESQTFLSGQLEKATGRLRQAETRTVAAESAPQTSPTARIETARAKLELSLAQESYASVRRRLDALDVILAEQQPLLQTVDPPSLPTRPSFPRPVLNISLGLILGLLLGTLIVVVRSTVGGTTRRVRTEEKDRLRVART